MNAKMFVSMSVTEYLTYFHCNQNMTSHANDTRKHHNQLTKWLNALSCSFTILNLSNNHHKSEVAMAHRQVWTNHLSVATTNHIVAASKVQFDIASDSMWCSNNYNAIFCKNATLSCNIYYSNTNSILCIYCIMINRLCQCSFIKHQSDFFDFFSCICVLSVSVSTSTIII